MYPLFCTGQFQTVFPTIPYSLLTQLNAVEETLQRRKCLHSIREIHLSVNAGIFEGFNGRVYEIHEGDAAGRSVNGGNHDFSGGAKRSPSAMGMGTARQRRPTGISGRIPPRTGRCAAQPSI